MHVVSLDLTCQKENQSNKHETDHLVINSWRYSSDVFHKGQQTTSAHIQAHQHPWQSP